MQMATMSSNNADNDDDSHTTLGAQQNDDTQMNGFESSSVDLLASPRDNAANAAQEQSPDASSSSSQSVISPSTQTLNVLSQHDAAGGGNLRYDMTNMEQDAYAVTASQQLATSITASELNGFANWKVTDVSLSEPGPLGVTVRRLTTSDGKSYTMIKRVKVGSQADKAGLKMGDIVGARYDEVCSWANKPRPIRFMILRKREDQTPIATNRQDLAKTNRASGSQIKIVQKPKSSSSSTTTTTTTSAAKTPPPTGPKAVTLKRPNAVHNTPRNSTMATNAAKTCNAMMSPEEEQAAVILASQLAATFLPTTGSASSTAPNVSNVSRQDEPMLVQESAAKTAAQKSTVIQEKPAPPQAPNDTAVIVAAARKITTNRQDKPVPPPPHDNANDGDIVPFCKACQKSSSSSSSRPHHALCPKHPEFDNSGALEKLQLVRRGMEMSCEACKSFYQHGRVVNAKLAHAAECPRGKQKLRQNGHVIDVNDTETILARQKKAAAKKRGGSTTKKKKDTSKSTSNNKKKQPSKNTLEKKATTENKPTECDDQSFSQVQDDYADAGLTQSSTQETAAATSTGRRANKKTRYDYESDSDSDDEQIVKENTRPPQPVSKRTKFVEQGSNVPLVVDTASKKKKKIKKPLRTQATAKSTVDDRQIKPTWVPCANPWGPSGYQEGDVVLVTPTGGFTHHETVYGGPRFTASPFGSEFDYGNTHRAPSEGFDVILLTRDPNAEHPWGFTYRRHEFGGACLVASVDPLSPAASAVYRGNESAQISGACLRVHDMILSMNGKSIGGMTELGVSIELEVCGRELELVVARYRDAAGAARQLVALERSEWKSFDEAMNDKSRLDWFEMNGGGSSTSINMVEETDAFAPFGIHGGTSRDPLGFEAMSPPPQQCGRSASAHNNFETQSQVSEQFSLSQLSLASPTGLLISRRSTHSQTFRGKSSARSVGTEVREDDDDQAWLGCVCGEIHPEPIRVFWIQCDDCKNWHNVAPVCVGFNELQASSVGTWVCRVCSDSVTEDQTSVGRSAPPVFPRGQFGKRLAKVPGPSSLGRNNPFSTPGSKTPSLGSKTPNVAPPKAPKRKSPFSTKSEILEDRKRRRTEDGSFLPLRSPRKKEDGTYARPCGRAPPGMTWDAIQGKYTPKSSKKKSTSSSSSSSRVPVKVVVVQPQPPPPKTRARGLPPIESPITPRTNVSADPSARRTEDGCFLPLRSPRKKEDGTYARPCGRAPPGMAWNAIQGKYVPFPKKKDPSPSSVPKKIVVPLPPPPPKKEASETPVKTPVERKAVLPADPSERRTEDGCFLPLRSPRQKEDGTYARPCGRAPPGMTWNATRGVYVPIEESCNDKQEESPAKEVNEPLSTPEEGDKSTHETPTGDEAAPAIKSVDKSTRETPSVKPSVAKSEDSSPCGDEPAPAVKAVDKSTRETPSSKPSVAKSEDSSPQNDPTSAESPVAPKKSSPPKKGSRVERDEERETRKTQDGCLRPKSKLKMTHDGMYARPRGRCPPGMQWDARRGVFAPTKRKAKSDNKPTSVVPSPKEAEQQTKSSPPQENVKPDTTQAVPTITPKIDLPSGPIKLVVTGNGIDTISGVVSPPEEINPLPVGTLVSVAERVWIGSNKQGGIGTILDYKESSNGDGTFVYDVKYSLGGRESGIESRWVSPHDFSKSGSVMRQK